VIEGALMILGQSVGVTVYKSALALNAKQACLLVAVEAPLSILLLHFLFLLE
jgi:hypothetical protein